MKKQKGFTLIEMIVVVVLLGILSAVAIPRMFGTADESHRQKAKMMAGTFKSAMEGARARWFAAGAPKAGLKMNSSAANSANTYTDLNFTKDGFAFMAQDGTSTTALTANVYSRGDVADTVYIQDNSAVTGFTAVTEAQADQILGGFAGATANTDAENADVCVNIFKMLVRDASVGATSESNTAAAGGAGNAGSSTTDNKCGKEWCAASVTSGANVGGAADTPWTTCAYTYSGDQKTLRAFEYSPKDGLVVYGYSTNSGSSWVNDDTGATWTRRALTVAGT